MHMYQFDKFLDMNLLNGRYLSISKVRRNDELTMLSLSLGAVWVADK